MVYKLALLFATVELVLISTNCVAMGLWHEQYFSSRLK